MKSAQLVCLLILQRWVYAFRIGKGLYDKTNNGLERMNQKFKYSFLNKRTNYSLSMLLKILLESFVATAIKT